MAGAWWERRARRGVWSGPPCPANFPPAGYFLSPAAALLVLLLDSLLELDELEELLEEDELLEPSFLVEL